MELMVINRRDINEQEWDTFITHSLEGSPYMLYQYINYIATHWHALIVSNGDEWQAVMPIEVKKKYGFSYVFQPPFSQHWGICFNPKSAKGNYEFYSWKHQIVSMFATELTKYRRVVLNFSPYYDDPVPFHWEGFTLASRVSYILSLSGPIDEIFTQFASPLKRQIRKAKRNELVCIREVNIEVLTELISLNEHQGNYVLGRHPERMKIIHSLGKWLLTTSYGKLLKIVDEDQNVLAAGLYIVFNKKMYYLTGAYFPGSGSSGAMAFLMWEAICRAKEEGCEILDFEGSMIKGVEHFFRKFGSYPIQYLQIQRNQLPLLIRWTQELIS